MKLSLFQSALDFRARAESFLVAHEAPNNLLLGLSAALIANPNLYPSQPYFAVVEIRSEVVAAALRTPPYNLVLSFCESPEPFHLIANHLHAQNEPLPGVVGPTDAALYFAETWQVLTGWSYKKNMAERIYQLTEVNPVPAASGCFRSAAETDRELLRQWLLEFNQEALGEADSTAVERYLNMLFTSPPELRGMYLWEDGEPVSLAAYSGPTPNGIRVGPVYTPLRFRGRGYASNCVAALSRYLLNTGCKFCFLFTDLANPTSNHIYQVIGYEPVCDVDEYRFSEARSEA